MTEYLDKTMQSTGAEATLVAGAMGLPGGGATQMGASTPCPVCATMNSALETYCSECGFLLASTPGDVAEPQAEETGYSMTDEKTGRTFPLRAGSNSVGREGCDLLLLDATVSRRHATVTVAEGAVTVTDLGSTNGTQVDGVPLPPNQPTAAGHGSIVRFGSSSLALTAPGAAAAAAPTEPEPAPEPQAAAATVASLIETTDRTFEIGLPVGETTLGRRQTCSAVLANDPYVSGLHARVVCDDFGCTLADAGSTNGTQMNGKRLQPDAPEALLDGDEVQIGRRSFVFRWTGPAAGLPEPAAEAEPEAAPTTEGDEAGS